MVTQTANLALLFLLPLTAAIFNGAWVLIAARYKQVPHKMPIGIIANAAVFISFFYAVSLWMRLLNLPVEERHLSQTIYDWISVGDLKIPFALALDPLSTLMILVVTGVGSLIHLYSFGYMKEDKGFGRFFVYLNLFLAAMLILVLAANLPLMFVGWEGVGLCSYLLIGFWFTEPAKASAGKKAFIVNRVGDLGFLTGIFLCYMVFRSVEFSGIAQALRSYESAAALPPLLYFIGIAFFIGACGKSAQFPLHIWLADAMAGPTPVSALIHAATMVTAGVYMIARLSFVYVLIPDVGYIIAMVGTFTAIFAASMALVENDIKKVLAFSTVSQLGFMFIGVGAGGYGAGVFHLMTHAFFKGLLFLGAGSVIHALHEEQDIRRMGGLSSRLPITHATFAVAWLCIIGFPFTSGFFSKDEILWHAYEAGYTGIYIAGLFAAALTAFYMTRLMVLVFWGRCRAEVKVWEKAHESPPVMWLPLAVLAVLAAVSGIVGHFVLEKFLEPSFALAVEFSEKFHLAHEAHTAFGELGGMAIATIVALGGAGLAYFFYMKNPAIPAQLARIEPVNKILNHKYYIDEIFDRLIVRPLRFFSEKVLWKAVDERTIDGFLNGTARSALAIGSRARYLQSGIVRYYALSIALGLAALLLYVGFWN